MNCPYCNGRTVVTNSRSIMFSGIDPGQYRRRECVECQRRFSTFERYEVKNDGETSTTLLVIEQLRELIRMLESANKNHDIL